MTQRLQTFSLALLLGFLAEGALAGVMAGSGNGGPCGGFGWLTLAGLLWHAPGLLLSSPFLIMSRPDNRDIFGYVGLGITGVIGALTFTTLFYFAIKRIRRPKT